MEFEIDIVRVSAATILGLLIGMIYYSPFVLGKVWARQVKAYANLTDADLKPRLAMVIKWLLMIFINAMIFEFFQSALHVESITGNIILAVIIWFGFAFTFSSWPVIFARQSRVLWLINNGAFLLMQICFGVLYSMWE
jgi:hypothetical protein